MARAIEYVVVAAVLSVGIVGGTALLERSYPIVLEKVDKKAVAFTSNRTTKVVTNSSTGCAYTVDERESALIITVKKPCADMVVIPKQNP